MHKCLAKVSQSPQLFVFAIWPERNLPVSPKPAANPKTTTPPNGFRMPAEWEPHAATWLAWPHQASDWPGKFAPIPWVYAEIVRHLHRREHVHTSRQRRGEGVRGPPGPGQGGCRFRPGRASSLADRPRLDARLRADVLPRTQGRAGPARLALQRLGQVPQLAERRRDAGAGRRADGSPDLAADLERPARRPRRRQHRRQRRRACC